jgi:hypothetical protein
MYKDILRKKKMYQIKENLRHEVLYKKSIKGEIYNEEMIIFIPPNNIAMNYIRQNKKKNP